jgi:hypothetical protein
MKWQEMNLVRAILYGDLDDIGKLIGVNSREELDSFLEKHNADDWEDYLQTIFDEIKIELKPIINNIE